MCLAWGAMGVQLCIVAAFRASGNMLMAMVLAIVSQFVLQFPLAYVLSRHTALHEAGLWWSFPVTNVVVALVALAWFARGSWKAGRLTEDAVLEARVAEDAVIDEGLR
jgi:Na+-driven multidrug efflux pump